MDEIKMAINPEIAQRIKAEAHKAGQGEAEWIRHLLMQHFEQPEQADPGADHS